MPPVLQLLLDVGEVGTDGRLGLDHVALELALDAPLATGVVRLLVGQGVDHATRDGPRSPGRDVDEEQLLLDADRPPPGCPHPGSLPKAGRSRAAVQSVVGPAGIEPTTPAV